MVFCFLGSWDMTKKKIKNDSWLKKQMDKLFSDNKKVVEKQEKKDPINKPITSPKTARKNREKSEQTDKRSLSVKKEEKNIPEWGHSTPMQPNYNDYKHMNLKDNEEDEHIDPFSEDQYVADDEYDDDEYDDDKYDDQDLEQQYDIQGDDDINNEQVKENRINVPKRFNEKNEEDEHIDPFSEDQYVADDDIQEEDTSKVISDDELQDIIEHAYEQNYEASATDILDDILNEGYVLEDGSEIHLNRVKSCKSVWMNKKKKALYEMQLLQEYKKKKEQVGEVEPKKTEKVFLICPGCNKKVKDGSKFCPECGYSFMKVNSPPAPPPATSPQEGGNRVPDQTTQQQGNWAQQQQGSKPQPAYINVGDLKRKSKLEIMVDTYNSAVDSGNPMLQRVMLEGITNYVYNLEDDDPNRKLINTIITSMIKDNKGKDPIDDMTKLASVFQKFQPQPQNTSESVEMTRAITRSIDHGISELRTGISEATGGGQDITQLFASCPVCKQPILKDSKICSYCGAMFEMPSAPGVYPQNQAQQAHFQQQQYQQQQRSGQMKKSSSHPQPKTIPQQQQVQEPNPAIQHQSQQVQAQQPQKPQISDNEYKKIQDYAKRLANFITKGKDPVKTVKAAWTFLDQEDKEKIIMGLILGRNRLFYILDRLAPLYPELQNYVSIVKSAKGIVWIDLAFETVSQKAHEEQLKISKEKLAMEIKQIETRLGFEIPLQMEG